MDNPYVNRIKVYRVLAYREVKSPCDEERWLPLEETYIIPSAVTDIVYVNDDYTIIKYAEQTYKIYRADFNTMFEVEVL